MALSSGSGRSRPGPSMALEAGDFGAAETGGPKRLLQRRQSEDSNRSPMHYGTHKHALTPFLRIVKQGQRGQVQIAQSRAIGPFGLGQRTWPSPSMARACRRSGRKSHSGASAWAWVGRPSRGAMLGPNEIHPDGIFWPAVVGARDALCLLLAPRRRFEGE
jgi:hypothetical protein